MPSLDPFPPSLLLISLNQETKMHLFELQELKEATGNFSPSKLIGKGSHGSVYRGLLKDDNLVAIKKQSLALQKLRDNAKIANEASILSSIDPNSYLINLLGISHDRYGNQFLITRYMPNGTLDQLLHVSATPPSWHKRIEIALQIAKGVRFLHDLSPNPIVHRDIKSANILFDGMWNAKLADFGLAVRLYSGTQEKLPAGTIGYIDPSYTTPDKLSTKIDVFSYGVVLLELVSGRKAMDVSKSPASIVEWALPLIDRGRLTEVCDKRVRLTRYVARAVDQLVHVAARCLSSEECMRPTMGEIVTNLEDLTAGLIRMPVLRKSFRDIIMNMMGLRKSRFGPTKTIGTCADHHGRGGDLSANTKKNSVSRGTLLVCGCGSGFSSVLSVGN
ncbi:hypothetical protein OROGR_020664 [Orobanche gracilis]